MAGPSLSETPTITTEGAWQKIATGITTGTIERLKSNYAFYMAFEFFLDPPPTDPIETYRDLFKDANIEGFNFSEPVDVYIYLVGTDDETTETNIENTFRMTVS
jgi:hypothetical protein